MTVTALVVFKVKEGVEVAIVPIVPEFEVKVIDVVPVNVPAVGVIAPVPSLVKVTIVPEALAFSVTPPLAAVASRVKRPLEFKTEPVLMLLLLETNKVVNVSPPELKLKG